MNPPEDPIDALMREQNAYVDDNGFTARVMTSVKRRQRRSWIRPALLLTAAAVGAVLAGLWLPWDDLALSFSEINAKTLTACALLLAVLGALTLALVAAIRYED